MYKYIFKRFIRPSFLLGIIISGVVSCIGDDSCKFDSIIPIENSDTLMPGETYLAEIHIPNFDSTLYYQCIVGDYDTISVSDSCKLDLNKDRTYTLMYQPDDFNKYGIYMIVSIKQKVGRHYYNGFIKSQDELGNEQYFTFKCDYFVSDN